jgi:hypothetical protein
MRAVSMCVKCFLAAVLIMGIYVGTAAAQGAPAGLTVWDESPWQITVKVKGYEFANIDNAPTDKVSGSVKLQAVMDVIRTDDITATPTGEIRIFLFDSGKENCDLSAFGTVVLNYVSGDSTEFAAEIDPAASTLPIKGVLFFSGKSTTKGLSGKVSTLGAYVIADFDPFETLGLTISGNVKDLKCTLVP